MASCRLVAMILVLGIGPMCMAADAREEQAEAGFASKGSADEIEIIKKLVFSSQRDGFEKHDKEAYLAPLSEDVQIITGRSKEPDKFDQVLDRKCVEALTRMKYHGKPTHQTTQSYEVVRAEVSDDLALLEVVTIRVSPTDSYRTGEIFRLRKTPSGWRIFLNRCWLIDGKWNGQTVAFDAEYWIQADRRVEQSRDAGDLRYVVDALGRAGRDKEAHDAAKELSQRGNVTGDEWIARGYMAVRAADEKDARLAFEKALAADPDAPVPPYFRDSED